MRRRTYLRGAGGLSLSVVAGCLERLGFEEASAWRDPPLVEDRPDAVYVPAAIEEMGVYGTAFAGEYAVTLSYTFPHRFWTVTGTDRRRVEVRADDTLHLMVDIWDPKTGVVLPVDSRIELFDGDGLVADRRLWPMLSQRMGFHYGDNVELPGEGTYTARIVTGPVDAKRYGAFEGRFEAAGTAEIDFTFDRDDVHDLAFELVAEDRQGERDALSLMDHSDHEDHGDPDNHGDSTHDDHGDHGSHDTDGHVGHHDDHENHADSVHEGAGDTHGEGAHHGDHGHDEYHPPSSRAPPMDALPGTVLADARSGDARILVVESGLSHVTPGEGTYLAISPRTPYNEVILPFTSIHVTVKRDGSVVAETDLNESLEESLGHHYGIELESLESGDELTVSIGPPPQVSRHDGYETAFFDFEDVVTTV